eukprot:TRINITY_DN31235_c0_g1_i1.p1 TRINITY_DN31235_c0_g1~~TRINITY_DN31235_c0_g1_i1.p1  ORF type:complete len:291 (-),score=21.66 TRINITY_DN31235_c0_g1_i1:87-866(-)
MSAACLSLPVQAPRGAAIVEVRCKRAWAGAVDGRRDHGQKSPKLARSTDVVAELKPFTFVVGSELPITATVPKESRRDALTDAKSGEVAHAANFDESDAAAGVDLIARVACALTKLAQQIQNDECVSVFHSRSLPCVSLLGYFGRLRRYFVCSDACFLCALIYIDRARKENPGFVVNEYTLHRLSLAALVLAAKFHEDRFFGNSFYAKVGGVTVKELNTLEHTLFKMLDYNVYICAEGYEAYHRFLQEIPSAVTEAVAQ